MLSEAWGYRGYMRAVRRFLAERLTPEQARRRLAGQLARRAEAFLHVIEHAVFASPAGPPSPYRRLFDHAGVSLADVKSLVHRDGVEPALGALYDAGVYLTQDEFKSRRLIRRGGIEIATQPGDFDNPLASAERAGAAFMVSTSGSGGRATAVRTSLDLLRHEAAYVSCYLEAFDLADRPIACWRGVPPVSSGINLLLRYARLGKRVEKWFAQNSPPVQPDTMTHHYTAAATLRAARRAGCPLPAPQYVHQDDAVEIARWLASQRDAGSPAHLDTNASSGVRICIAALDHAIDIAGTFFRFGGEPYTPAKAEVVHEAGCRAVCHYSAAEVSHMGIACGDGDALDDVHILTDKLGVIQRDKPIATAGAAGRTVPALLVTTILPACPKLMINVENGDYGVLSTHRCACPLGELGFDLQLSSIRGYDKCTSEGMNYLGSDLLPIVEQALPARFGGRPTDYQFVEREQRGIPKIDLVVSPRAGAIDEAAAVACVYEALRSLPGGRLMSDFWEDAGTVAVVRREPYANASAKVLPLHTHTGD